MKYLKLNDDPTYWLVLGNGKRVKINSMDELYQHGLHPVEVVTVDMLESIPVEKPAKVKADA